METAERITGQQPSTSSGASRSPLQRWSSILFIVVGVLLPLAAAGCAGLTALQAWFAERDRFLVASNSASLLIPLQPAPTPCIEPLVSAPRPPYFLSSWPSASAPPPASTMTSPPSALASRSAAATLHSVSKPQPDRASTSPILAHETYSLPLPVAPAAVKLRIPSIGVNRAIIELPRTLNPRSGAWTRDTDRLLRSGRKDLVGHWGGSAQPGQEGNTILVGHNYGYGYNGVFVRLDRLKVGREIQVTNEAGQTFTYQVQAVQQVKWRRRNQEELLKHTKFLATGGPERLTLVTCSGATRAPFPDRTYVVAVPVR